jgi:hypothetical protein
VLVCAAGYADADSSVRGEKPPGCTSSMELKPYFLEIAKVLYEGDVDSAEARRTQARALCLARQDKLAARKRYEAAFLRYLDVVGDHNLSSLRRKEKQLFEQCVALRSTTHRFHQEESLIADEEYERLCYLGLAAVWDHPDDVDNVRRNYPEGEEP